MPRATTHRDRTIGSFRGGDGVEDDWILYVGASPAAGAVGRRLEIGREPVVLERVIAGGVEDHWMSRWHATVTRSPDGRHLIVRDGAPRDGVWTASANGTWSGGREVGEAGVALGSGQAVRTGRTLWLAVRNPAAPSPASLLIGCSAAIDHARTELELVTSGVALRLERSQRVTQSLLVTGARGTGKQVVAREACRLLAAKRGRAEVAFRQVVAPALADGTAAADLFGVVERYATNVKARPGYFEQAHGGVLFLDEVGDTPPGEQAKLLTALQEREVVPLGGRAPVPFDCLVVAATNRDLGELGREGRFRADLLDRLGRFVIELPPLVARPEDIPPIARALLGRHGFAGALTAEAVEELLARPWQGNVRELDALLERAVALAQLEGHEAIEPALLRRAGPGAERVAAPAGPTAQGPSPPALGGRHGRPTREQLLRDLEETGWNQTEVGRRYGKHPRQVTRWMQYLGIDKPS